jgi:hypothetical protein
VGPGPRRAVSYSRGLVWSEPVRAESPQRRPCLTARLFPWFDCDVRSLLTSDRRSPSFRAQGNSDRWTGAARRGDAGRESSLGWWPRCGWVSRAGEPGHEVGTRQGAMASVIQQPDARIAGVARARRFASRGQGRLPSSTSWWKHAGSTPNLGAHSDAGDGSGPRRRVRRGVHRRRRRRPTRGVGVLAANCSLRREVCSHSQRVRVPDVNGCGESRRIVLVEALRSRL